MRALLQQPRTLILAGLGVIALILSTILVYLLLRPVPVSSTDPEPIPSPSASYNREANDAASPEEGLGPPEVQEALWGPIADRFARNFVNTKGGHTKWRKRLIHDSANPDVTAQVAEQLETVDVRKVPRGNYEGRELVSESEFEIGVKVNYRQGWAMVLWLVTDGNGWEISAYDEWEG